MCPDGTKKPFKTTEYKGNTMSALNEATKTEFQKLKAAHAETGSLALARRATNLTIAQLKELKNAGLVTGEILFDFGSHKARFIVTNGVKMTP